MDPASVAPQHGNQQAPQVERTETAASPIITAPPNSGELVLGRSLVSLLDEAVERSPNPTAYNQLTADGWQPLSNADFRRRAENLALGLLGNGLERGDRVAFFTHSDLSFCLADMACLIAGLVDVPIYLTHTPTAIRHILVESEARALVVSDETLLTQLLELLPHAPELRTVVLFEAPQQAHELPDGVTLKTFAELEEAGDTVRAAAPGRIDELKNLIDAEDLATIIYTSGTTGVPKGVMLSHQNISSNAIGATTGLGDLKFGSDEVMLSFLPLTHIFARTMQYAFTWYGSSIYYSDPNLFSEHLRSVRPTVFAAVPRVIEKAFERILLRGASLTGAKRALFDWALELARRYDIEHPPTGLDALQLALADRLVLSKWREALGGRVQRIVVGGAALRGELVNIFAAAKIAILQGYGLTETSPIVTFNRPYRNRPGTVGQPLAGVEVKIADDGEVLTRGPHIMKGYYKQPELTAEVIDAEGWFHTGDLGEITSDGFLRITGRKKNLFKLSTGKYVMPQPLEDHLEGQPLIDAALVVGEGEKYCAALLFVNRDAILALEGLDLDKTADAAALLEQPAVQERFRQIVAEANRDLPHWSTIKRVALIPDTLTTESGLLTPKLSVRREKVLERYRSYLDALYDKAEPPERGVILSVAES